MEPTPLPEAETPKPISEMQAACDAYGESMLMKPEVTAPTGDPMEAMVCDSCQ